MPDLVAAPAAAPAAATDTGAAPPADPTPNAAEAKGTDSSRVDKQIERALKKGRAELKAKAGERPRGEGGKFLKTAAEPVAAKPAATKETPAAEFEPEAIEQAKPAVTGKSAKELLEAGDLEAAFEAAFGKKPQDFKIDSRKWEEWRKAKERSQRTLATERAAAIEEVGGQRRQLQTVLAEAQKTYGPMVEAKKLFDAGDVIGAVKSAFGIELNDLQKRALAQFHGKNPEVEQLRREMAEREAAAKKREEELTEQSRQAQLSAQTTAYLEHLQQELIDGTDPQVAGLATKPRFIQRVYQIQRQHYDQATKTSLPSHVAADMARNEIVAEFGSVLGGGPRDTAVPVESDQPGSKAASSGKAKASSTSLPQRGAAEASLPGRKLGAREQVDKYTALARAELGLS